MPVNVLRIVGALPYQPVPKSSGVTVHDGRLREVRWVPYNVRMTPTDDEISAQLQPDVPHAARIWNHWMGGKDNFAADRAAGDAVAQVYPEIVLMAKHSRQFLIRVVHHLAAEAGIRQFLDI